MDKKTLTTAELAARWNMHPKTLSNWRVKGVGPAYLKLGIKPRSAIKYRIEDIEAFEQENHHAIRNGNDQ